LADFSEIGAREAVGDVADEVEIDVASDGSLPQVGLENAETGGLVGEGNLDDLVQSSGTEQRLVHDFRSVGGSNDEDVLFGADTVHLGQQLVDDSVSSAASIALPSASGDGNGVQLIEEKHAGCGSSGLIEDISDVGLALSEPHGQQFRSLDGDEVGAALVGDCLGEQGLAASGRTVEEDSLRGLHAELVELFGVFDREQNHLLELLLGLFEASDVLPLHVGHFDVGFTQRGGVD
jgi:hypothetical protein